MPARRVRVALTDRREQTHSTTRRDRRDTHARRRRSTALHPSSIQLVVISNNAYVGCAPNTVFSQRRSTQRHDRRQHRSEHSLRPLRDRRQHRSTSAREDRRSRRAYRDNTSPRGPPQPNSRLVDSACAALSPHRRSSSSRAWIVTRVVSLTPQ
jgi:hypothetical protein